MRFESNTDGQSSQPHFGHNSRVIAAIDFGTSHSGYAVMHIASTTTEACYKWPDQPSRYCKNLTAIRYQNVLAEPTVESWGYTARKSHTCKGSNNNNAFRYLDRFKLHLDDGATHNLPKLPSTLTALDIISDYLHNLYLKAFRDIQDKWGNDLEPENIVWFLTVPAMWSERAKQEMREAAVLAQMVPPQDKNNKNRLNIILEPEAAAMHCCNQSAEYSLVPGETFMIVDAGGGTVDLTAHEILRDPVTGGESLREITHGIGKSCGSTFIDEAFVKFIEEKCGKDNLDSIRVSHPASWLHIMKLWEDIKRGFAGNITQERIEIPHRLRQLMERDGLLDIDDDEDDIVMTSDDLFAMFDPIVDSTLELVELQLENSCKALATYRNSTSSGRVGDCKIDKMFFVGGFSDSDYLWKKAQERFGSRVRIFRPHEAGAAVVKGAVLCGKYPRFIRSRCSRSVYGIKTSGLWTNDNPVGESGKIWNEAEQAHYADNIFHVIVAKDQQVGIDEIISTRFVPVNTTQMYATLELYTTTLDDEKYMVPGMLPAATLEVPLSSAKQAMPLPVRVQFVQDVSSSMDGEKLQASKGGMKEICEKLTLPDEVGIVKFGSNVIVFSAIQPYSNAIENKIDELEALGMTALYDAIAEGIRGLKERAEASNQVYQNILMVATDGEENVSTTTLDGVSALLENSGIPNFRMILAIAGSMNTNIDLIKLCKYDYQDYCDVINVADSSDGIKQAYVEMDQRVQLLRAGQELGRTVIRLDLKFGATQVSANAVVEGTDVNVEVPVRFQWRT